MWMELSNLFPYNLELQVGCFFCFSSCYALMMSYLSLVNVGRISMLGYLFMEIRPNQKHLLLGLHLPMGMLHKLAIFYTYVFPS